jgi:methionyl-tRNA formyltransferase
LLKRKGVSLKILIITEEDEFYIPLSTDYILKNCPYEIAEVVCVVNPRMPGKLQAARKFFKVFGLLPVLSHGLRLVRAKMLDALPWLNFSSRYYSVKRVCQSHKMPYSVCRNVNSPSFIEHCRNLKIDLVAAVSPSQIFKEELINLPRYGCINIHTAKLPKYRGLYPTYWAMAHGEKTIGISIHYMEKSVDTGKILLQTEIEIPPETTLDKMLTVTKLKGAQLLLEAIRQIAEGKTDAHYAEGEGSYFSHPTPESYKMFKSHGYKLW